MVDINENEPRELSESSQTTVNITGEVNLKNLDQFLININDEITKKFTDYFSSIAPDSVSVNVKPHHGGTPYVSPTDTIEYLSASEAIAETFGKKPVPVRGGGSIPIVALFEKELGVKSILLGFGLDSDAIHSPNEHYGIFNYLKGIETIPLFFKNYAEKF